MSKRLLYGAFLSLLFTALIIAAGPHALADTSKEYNCSCSPDHVFTNYASAERAFLGEVDNGWLDKKSGQVNFEVVVLDSFMGENNSTVTLSTPLPTECGIDVRVGMDSVFVLGVDDTRVSRCDFESEDEVIHPRYLKVAVPLVESFKREGRVDVSAAADYLRPGISKGSVEAILSIAHMLEPGATYRATEHSVTFGDLTVSFEGNLVASYDCR